MSTDLKYLALTAMLTASLSISYVVAQVMTNGPRAELRRSGATAAAAVGQTRRPRLYQCDRDLAPFAVLVILIQMTGKANGTTALLAASFFWLRLAHAVVYWAAIPYIRTIVFTLGYVVVIGLFVELMM